VLAFAVMGCLGTRLPVALIAGYALHGSGIFFTKFTRTPGQTCSGVGNLRRFRLLTAHSARRMTGHWRCTFCFGAVNGWLPGPHESDRAVGFDHGFIAQTPRGLWPCGRAVAELVCWWDSDRACS
jgi:hypothetical protein